MAEPKDDPGEKESKIVKDAVDTIGRQTKEGKDPTAGEQNKLPREAVSNQTPAKPQSPEETRIQQQKEKDKGGRF